MHVRRNWGNPKATLSARDATAGCTGPKAASAPGRWAMSRNDRQFRFVSPDSSASLAIVRRMGPFPFTVRESETDMVFGSPGDGLVPGRVLHQADPLVPHHLTLEPSNHT